MRIGFFGPHPDDIELGCGGILSKMSSSDVEIRVTVFSDCSDVSPSLTNECISSLRTLSVCDEHIDIRSYPNMHLPEVSHEIRNVMEEVERDFNPQTIFVPCSADRHQDHATVHSEALRAFRYATIIGYVLPWNCMIEPYNIYSVISEDNLNMKISALKNYRSQLSRTYMNEEYVRGLARHLGWKIGREYAEGFEAIRIIEDIE